MFSRRVQPLAYRLYRPAAPKAVTVQRTDNGKAAPASGRPANPLATSSTASASSASVGFSRESVLLPSTPDQGFSSANLIGDGEAVGVGNQEKAGDAKAPAQPKDAEPKNDGDAGKPEQPQTSGKPEGSGNKPEDAGNSASGATGESRPETSGSPANPGSDPADPPKPDSSRPGNSGSPEDTGNGPADPPKAGPRSGPQGPNPPAPPGGGDEPDGSESPTPPDSPPSGLDLRLDLGDYLRRRYPLPPSNPWVEPSNPYTLPRRPGSPSIPGLPDRLFPTGGAGRGLPKPPAYDSPDGRDPYGFPRGYEPPVGPAERGGFGWGGFGIKF